MDLYNLVYIVQFDDGIKYVVRVPAIGRGDRLTETAKSSLRSQALTMRFIRRETMAPLPDIYAFDTTTENEIGAPYMVMSFIPGDTVASKWFDDTGPTPLEQRRLRTLDTLAKAMSQLQKFRFDKIGSLQFTDNMTCNEIKIGPCYCYDQGILGDENYGNELALQSYGPFESTKSYLRYCLDHDDRDLPQADHVGARKLVAMLISYLPSPRFGRETFVLSLPDFDSQNIMIDERGNLTGIIDWDNVQTNPRFNGFSCFPGWITRDWDPLMYGYPHVEWENSPVELKRYRQRYNGQMKQHLNGAGDSIFTVKSHIFEAVVIAATKEICRYNIVRKIMQHVLPGENVYDVMNIIDDVGNAKLTPNDKRNLQRGFQALLSTGKW